MAAPAGFARVGGKRTSLGKRVEACVGQVAGPKDPHQWIVCACGRISAATTVCGLRVNAWWNSDDDAPKPVRSSRWGGAFASSKRLGDGPQIVDPFDRYDCGIALRRRCGAALSEQHTEQPSKRCHPDASHG